VSCRELIGVLGLATSNSSSICGPRSGWALACPTQCWSPPTALSN